MSGSLSVYEGNQVVFTCQSAEILAQSAVFVSFELGYSITRGKLL